MKLLLAFSMVCTWLALLAGSADVNVGFGF